MNLEIFKLQNLWILEGFANADYYRESSFFGKVRWVCSQWVFATAFSWIPIHQNPYFARTNPSFDNRTQWAIICLSYCIVQSSARFNMTSLQSLKGQKRRIYDSLWIVSFAKADGFFARGIDPYFAKPPYPIEGLLPSSFSHTNFSVIFHS